MAVADSHGLPLGLSIESASPIVLVNLDLAGTVGVEHFTSILSFCRIIGIPCVGAVGFPHSGGIAA
jgi:hypothetical protein